MALSYYFNSHETVNITNANYNGGNAITLISPMNCVINVVNANYNAIGIYLLNSSPCDNNIITVVNANNNQYGIYLTCACHNTFNLTNVNNNSIYGIYLNMSSDNIINNMSASGNVTAQIFFNAGINYLNRAVLGAGVEVAGYFTGNADPKLFSQFHGGGVYSRIYTDGGQINSQDTDRPGGTGKMWKMAVATQAAVYGQIGDYTIRVRNYPLTLSVAKIAVSANSLVTVTAWMRKDNAISIGSGLMCKGGQLAGVATDVIKYNNNVTDWENLSISFTPTEEGVIEILAFAFWNGDAANAYVGELTVSQG